MYENKFREHISVFKISVRVLKSNGMFLELEIGLLLYIMFYILKIVSTEQAFFSCLKGCDQAAYVLYAQTN